jgi:NitT/TauT family transport system permease protein
VAYRVSDQSTVSVRTAQGIAPNRYDLLVFLIVIAVFAGVVIGAGKMLRPMAALELTPVSLDPANLPLYALLTTLRMFAAIVFSLVFTFVIATLAARSRKAELVIIPALDILQSVPVLGFLTFTVAFFIGVFPGRELGAELAAIFAIFTSQAWNMAFSFYQSLKTVPRDLEEAATQFQLTPWQRFWRLDVPFATPGLIWNTMMSMSGGWFFVVASEAISVGDVRIALPGIGSYLALAIAQQNFAAVGWAVLAMGGVILLYDQLVFRPVVAWGEKFRMEQTAAQAQSRSWLYDAVRRTRAIRRLAAPLYWLTERASRLSVRLRQMKLPARFFPHAHAQRARRFGDRLWTLCVLAAMAWAVWTLVMFAHTALQPQDMVTAFIAACMTLLRVVVLIALASLIWVPVGVWIGLRPAFAERIQPLAQFLAAFPANVLFPPFVMAIVAWNLNPDIWLSPLMILGTQWYILFNVIAGAHAFPNDLREAAVLSGVRGWQWWRRVMLPGIFPYYVTGALTATGGSWNASIVAEVASWGQTRLEATGIGAYIANATEAGDFPRVVLGIAMMSVFVIVLNRLLWRRLYVFAENRLRFD